MAEGHTSVTVASRFGTFDLPRQILFHRDTQTHLMPGNAILPPHNGLIITRGLQEWSCLLPQELPFASVARLLGWQTHETHILAETTLRSLVRSHGQLIRQAEQAEVVSLAAQDDLTTLGLHFVPHDQPRRRSGWPAELNTAVDTALAAQQPCPPNGVSWADWERVIAARRACRFRPVEELRYLGPVLEADQVLPTVDEVLTRKPEAGRFLELRTARVVTAAGYRYVSGIGQAFLRQLQVVTVLALGAFGPLLLIADGARWIRSFFTDTLSQVTRKTMLLDWHHLRQRCLELSSRICRSRAAKAHFLRQLYRRLWRGDVPGALAVLEAQRAETKNEAKLDELMAYLQARQSAIPNYRERRMEQRYIGSGHVEKANDLIVARRQKNRGMQWSEATSDVLAVLRTLLLNGGWHRYWQQREVLPLVAS
jgi:hypothetical protein